jgi:hypothetical protein
MTAVWKLKAQLIMALYIASPDANGSVIRVEWS